MAKKASASQPWDVRPRQPVGDAAPDALYLAVGKALSRFGWFESHLGILFGFFLTDGANVEMPVRSFGSVRTFEGRLEMLRTAAEVFFKLHKTSFQAEFEKLSKGAWREFGARRNELVHGISFEFGPALNATGQSIGRYYLLAPAMDAQKRPLGGEPKYCYVAADVEHYAAEFDGLVPAVVRFIQEVAAMRVARRADG